MIIVVWSENDSYFTAESNEKREKVDMVMKNRMFIRIPNEYNYNRVVSYQKCKRKMWGL